MGQRSPPTRRAERVVLGLRVFPQPGAPDAAESTAGLVEQVDAFERSLIEDALRRCGGVVPQAAAAFGLPRKTLGDKLKRLGIGADQ